MVSYILLFPNFFISYFSSISLIFQVTKTLALEIVNFLATWIQSYYIWPGIRKQTWSLVALAIAYSCTMHNSTLLREADQVLHVDILFRKTVQMILLNRNKNHGWHRDTTLLELSDLSCQQCRYIRYSIGEIRYSYLFDFTKWSWRMLGRAVGTLFLDWSVLHPFRWKPSIYFLRVSTLGGNSRKDLRCVQLLHEGDFY